MANGAFQLTIKGGAIFIGELKRIIGRTQGLCEDAITEFIYNVERSAKENCPVDTGDLRQSITAVLERTSENISGKVECFENRYPPIGAYVEFGTGKSVMIEPGLEEYASTFRKDYSESRKGMSAQPFLFPAFFDHKEEFLQDLKNVLR